MDLGLKNRVILCAGAGKGLGYGTAMTAAEEGAKVVIGSRTEDELSLAAEEITRKTGSEAAGIPLDMNDGDSIRDWVEAAYKKFGRIDGVLVNAGGPPTGVFESFTDSDWQRAFELTLLGSVRLIRESAGYIRKNTSGGAILSSTSISVKEPVDSLIMSNVMRSGVVGLVKTLSREFAPYRIRVNNIIPGFFDTDRMKALDAKKADTRNITQEQVRKEREQLIPLGRYGRPEEFGKAAVFLLSEAASYVTGMSFTIDGGVVKTLW